MSLHDIKKAASEQVLQGRTEVAALSVKVASRRHKFATMVSQLNDGSVAHQPRLIGSRSHKVGRQVALNLEIRPQDFHPDGELFGPDVPETKNSLPKGESIKTT
ncbi:MAG: hypothetical protein A2W65_01050 [Candidatus Taylorbacteria bacterium RIFCSPLOWO2_02_50_13]|nr:MAG: hypothetical protein A2W65_01050 [Candidatus Taylorbacteria bacterium RIFCSPLOWO2_02_50_13]